MVKKTLFGMLILLIGAFAVFTACKQEASNAGTEVISYTVTFVTNGGGPLPQQNVPEGGRATAPQDPIRDGFTFVGWFTDNGTFNNQWRFSYPVSGHTILFGKWTQNAPGMYTVYFNSTGGSPVGQVAVPANGKVPEPAMPTRDGYTFAGWYSDAGLTIQWIFSTGTVSGTLTLFAKWTQNGGPPGTFTVTFNSNGGSAVPTQTVSSGGTATRPPNPTKASFTFVDWYGDAGLSAAYNFSTPVTQNITLHAKWSENSGGGDYSNLPRAYNPIVTSIYTADPSAHVWPTDPTRLYLYPSQDVFPSRGCNLMDRYHVFSTDNMTDWIDHGEILRRDDLPTSTWGPHHDDAYFMWAPDAAYNPNVPGKGPYFFIFPHATGTDGSGPNSWGSTWKFGVAWSTSPYSGFKNNEVVMLKDMNGNVINGGGELIDPCIFQDGTDYYLATGGSQQFRIARLNPNMVQLAEDFHVYPQTQLPYYHEGPWMFTRTVNGNKIYYLMYPGNPTGRAGGDDLVYATSSSVYGPWTYKGSIMGQVNTGDTSHGSIVEFKGRWYLFYHNAKISNGNGTLRSVCVDELFFNADGTIQPVIQTTTSVTPVGPVANAGDLNSKFGAGNWTIEEKYSPTFGQINMNDYQFNAKYTVGRTNAQGQYVDSNGNPTSSNAQKVANPNVTAGGTGVAQARIETNKTWPHTQGLDQPGTYVQFANVTGSAGKAVVEVEYGRGVTDAASVQIIVNPGASQKTYQLNCPPTTNWEDPPFGNAQARVDMTAGNNTIRFSGGAINIVSISIYLAK